MMQNRIRSLTFSNKTCTNTHTSTHTHTHTHAHTRTLWNDNIDYILYQKPKSLVVWIGET